MRPSGPWAQGHWVLHGASSLRSQAGKPLCTEGTRPRDPWGSRVSAGAGALVDAQGGQFCSKELRGSLGPVAYSQLSDTAQA